MSNSNVLQRLANSLKLQKEKSSVVSYLNKYYDGHESQSNNGHQNFIRVENSQ